MERPPGRGCTGKSSEIGSSEGIEMHAISSRQTEAAEAASRVRGGTTKLELQPGNLRPQAVWCGGGHELGSFGRPMAGEEKRKRGSNFFFACLGDEVDGSILFWLRQQSRVGSGSVGRVPG